MSSIERIAWLAVVVAALAGAASAAPHQIDPDVMASTAHERIAILESHIVQLRGATAMHWPMTKAAEKWEKDAETAPDAKTRKLWLAFAAELRSVAAKWEAQAREEQARVAR
jgi:hypothetical protein